MSSLVKPEGLQAEAMLTRLSIPTLTTTKRSQKVAEGGAKAIRADERAVRGWKNLLGSGQKLNGKPTSPVDRITQLANQARAIHYQLALPWDKGVRLLPGKLFDAYCPAMEAFSVRFEAMVEKELIPVYPQLVAEDKALLGDDYDDTDYPTSVDRLRKEYSFKWHLDPVPSTGDIRVEVSKERESILRRQIQASNDRLARRALDAHKTIYHRLHKVVQSFYSKMMDMDSEFHDTIVSNITAVVELAPSLDIHDDQELQMACAAALPLTLWDAKVLRKDITLRPSAAKQAVGVLNQIEAALAKL